MKQEPTFNFYSICGTAALLIGFLLSCTKTGNIIADDYPNPKIYWTGSGEIIRIPESDRYPYKIDEENQKVYITLGFSTSGLKNRDAFTVNLVVDRDTIHQLQQEGVLPNTIDLEPDMIDIPPSATVEQGKDGALIQLSLDMTALADHEDDTLALAIRLDSPSQYELNPALSTAIILINYRAIIGISCPDDEASPGRIFIPFETSEDVNGWDYGGLQPVPGAPGQLTITRNNDDGYGIAVKWDQLFNLDEYPYLAMRVYEEPTDGVWLLKFYNGLADYVLRPENGTYKQLSDGSRIYYWNFAEATGLSGEVSSNIQVVIEGPNGQSLTYGWLKTYQQQDIILQCITE